MCVCVSFYASIVYYLTPMDPKPRTGWVYVYTWMHVPWMFIKYIWNMYVVLSYMCRHTIIWYHKCGCRGPEGHVQKEKKQTLLLFIIYHCCLSHTVWIFGGCKACEAPFKKNTETAHEICKQNQISVKMLSWMLAPLHATSTIRAVVPRVFFCKLYMYL